MLISVKGFGEALSKWRQDAELSRSAASAVLDVSPESLVRWEQAATRSHKKKKVSVLRVQKSFVDSFVRVYKERYGSQPEIKMIGGKRNVN